MISCKPLAPSFPPTRCVWISRTGRWARRSSRVRIRELMAEDWLLIRFDAKDFLTHSHEAHLRVAPRLTELLSPLGREAINGPWPHPRNIPLVRIVACGFRLGSWRWWCG